MTSIICRGIDSGNFNVWGFYKARFNRLYPALGMMLIVVLLLCIFTLTTSDLLSAGKNALSSALFISNFYYYSNSGYFDQSSMLNWFLHTWSLSVEWQFYLFYPLCLFLWKSISGKHSHLILALFIASLLASSLMNYDNKDAGYYLLHTRAWELLAGGLAYFFSINSGARSTSIFGWVLITLSIILIPSDAIWPGYLAISPVAGACLILASNYNYDFLPKISVINKIGLWSYSIYLWHWPIVVLLYVNSKTDSIYFVSLGIFFSLLLGWLSYRFIETFRFSNRNSILCLSSGFAIITISLFVISTDGMRYRINNSLSDVLNYKMSWVSQRNGKCFLDPSQRPEDFKLCPDEPTKGYTLIWGDSHAAQLIPGFEVRKGGNSGFVQRTASLCLPVVNIAVKSRPHCKDINSYVMNEIKLNPPSKVILAASWTSPSYKEIDINENLKHTVKLLKDAGVKDIYIIGTVPVWRDSLPKLIERNGLTSIPSLGISYVIASSFEVDRNMREYFLKSPAHYISIIDILCGKNSCLTTPEGVKNAPMQWDNAHLTEPGAIFVMNRLNSYVR